MRTNESIIQVLKKHKIDNVLNNKNILEVISAIANKQPPDIKRMLEKLGVKKITDKAAEAIKQDFYYSLIDPTIQKLIKNSIKENIHIHATDSVESSKKINNSSTQYYITELNNAVNKETGEIDAKILKENLGKLIEDKNQVEQIVDASVKQSQDGLSKTIDLEKMMNSCIESLVEFKEKFDPNDGKAISEAIEDANNKVGGFQSLFSDLEKNYPNFGFRDLDYLLYDIKTRIQDLERQHAYVNYKLQSVTPNKETSAQEELKVLEKIKNKVKSLQGGIQDFINGLKSFGNRLISFLSGAKDKKSPKNVKKDENNPQPPSPVWH